MTDLKPRDDYRGEFLNTPIEYAEFFVLKVKTALQFLTLPKAGTSKHDEKRKCYKENIILLEKGEKRYFELSEKLREALIDTMRGHIVVDNQILDLNLGIWYTIPPGTTKDKENFVREYHWEMLHDNLETIE